MLICEKASRSNDAANPKKAALYRTLQQSIVLALRYAIDSSTLFLRTKASYCSYKSLLLSPRPHIHAKYPIWVRQVYLIL
jgi:hypothetical protein